MAVSPVSLQKICGDHLPIAIVNHPSVKEYIFCSSASPLESSSKFEEWIVPLENIISKIIEKFPTRLVNIVPKSAISLVALQMYKWADFNKSNFDLPFGFGYNFFNCSFFTSKRTIDEEMLAKVLVKDNRLETVVQYKIACYYFMEETIVVLWNQLRESPNFKELINKNDSRKPFLMWSEYLEEKRKLSTQLELRFLYRSFLRKSFYYGLKHKNVSAVKYYWYGEVLSKNIFIEAPELIDKTDIRDNYESWPFVDYNSCNLSPRELLLTNDFERHRNILLFLFSHLNRMDLKKYFSFQKLTSIFKYFIFWPYQNYILDKFESDLQEIDNFRHVCIVRYIVDMINDPHLGQTYDYRNLLKKYLINRRVDPRKHLFIVESLRSPNCFFIPTIPILKNLLALQSLIPDEELVRIISEFQHLHSQEMYFIVNREQNDENSSIISLRDLQLDEEFLNNQNVQEFPYDQ